MKIALAISRTVLYDLSVAVCRTMQINSLPTKIIYILGSTVCRTMQINSLPTKIIYILGSKTAISMGNEFDSVTGHLSEGSFVRNVLVQIPKFDAKLNTNPNPNPNHSPNPNSLCLYVSDK